MISIIIVSYNNFHLLDNCLESVFNKIDSNYNFEVIVVDNNSQCGDVEEITNKYKNIVLIKNSENLGFSKANNQAALIAKGEYLLLLNNDTILIENPFAYLLKLKTIEESNFLIGIKMKNKDLSFQQSAFKFPSAWESFSSNFFLYLIFRKIDLFQKYYVNIQSEQNLKHVDYVIGAFMFLKKEFYLKLNGFDEKFFFFHEDIELCRRVWDVGGLVIYCPQTSIIHFGGATTGNLPWFKYRNMHISRIQFFHKHLKFPEKHLALLFELIGIIIRIPIFFLLGSISLNFNLIKRAYIYFKLLFVYKKNEFKNEVKVVKI